MKVKQLMTRNPEVCTRNTDLAAAAMIMWRNDCGVVPVTEDDRRRVVGVITDRDVCMAVATRHRRAEEITAGEVMTGEVFGTAPGEDVHRALAVMREHRVHRLPVVDANGDLQGILSLNDVVLSIRPEAGREHGAITPADLLETMQALCAHAPIPELAQR